MPRVTRSSTPARRPRRPRSTPRAGLPVTLAVVVFTLLAAGAASTGIVAPRAAASEVHPDDWPPPGSVWTVRTTVTATVEDNFAVVSVIADIGNRGPDPEFPFRVRVPDDAMVTGFTIERDGEVHHARIEDRHAAREEYEDTRSRELTGGLVEKQRHASVYAFLVNVAERESVRATLTYERYLTATEGLHHLDVEAPVSGFGQDLGAAFDVRVRHADGVLTAWGDAGDARVDGDAWRVTHAVGPRHAEEAATPFNVTYAVAPTAAAGNLVTTVWNGTGYFAHAFRAAPEERALPVDLVLVLDVSGSMSGLKMRQLQDAATQVVASLRDGDRLHVVLFSTDAGSLWEGLRFADQPARAAAVAAIQDAFAAGGTNIADGLARGFDAFPTGGSAIGEEPRFRALVFLTDGRATNGERDAAKLRALARDANDAGAAVFAVAFGRDADASLVTGFAEDGGGRALRVPEGAGAEVDLRRFMEALTTPVLSDVRVHYEGDVVAFDATAPILFSGSELLVVGTFPAGAARVNGTVVGLAPDGPRTYAFDVPVDGAERPFLPRLVAFQEIRDLERQIAANGEDPAWIARLVTLALTHGFVTDYTSLVLSLPQSSGEPGGCADCTMAWSGDGMSADSAATSKSYAYSAPGSAPPSTEALGGGGGGDDAYAADSRRDSDAAPTFTRDARGAGDGGDDAGERDASPGASGAPGASVPAPASVLAALALAGVALALRARRRALR